MYKVIYGFVDTETGIDYKTGDTFNHEGVKPARIKSLSTYANSIGQVLIEFVEVEDEKEESEEDKVAEDEKEELVKAKKSKTNKEG